MLNRRDAMLRLGLAGTGALTLPGLLQAEAVAGRPSEPGASATGAIHRTAIGKAKNCILIYLWGGPPQMDTFDLKPEAPQGIRTLFSPIDTVTPGIQICDQLPRIARVTDKMAIIRSYSHGSNIHEVSVYHTLTGKFNPKLAGLRNHRNRNDFPNAAAVVSKFTPPGSMPASVTIPNPIGHDGVVYSGTYAGFLGPKYDPMELKPPAEVKDVAPHSIDLPKGLTAARLQSRFGLLKVLEQRDRQLQRDGGPRYGRSGYGMEQFREQAYRMLLSKKARAAFDVHKEPANVRERYGRNDYGEAMLLSRRLIEAGVRLVTVVWYYVAKKDGNVLNVWDNHGGTASINKITGYQMLKENYCLPSLDQGYSALLEDLAQRGLLDETLVVALGEFGRTPKINKQLGRDHWGACQSVLLAGGGIRGGHVHGASDRHAAYPTTPPVTPEDFLATIYHAMGIPPETTIRDAQNRPYRVCEGEVVRGLFG
jgi:Protein of unknown function (DUF1501)